MVSLLKLAVSPDDEEFNSRVVAYNGCEYVCGMDFGVWHDKLLGYEAACCDVGFVPPPTDVYRKVLAASRDHQPRVDDENATYANTLVE